MRSLAATAPAVSWEPDGAAAVDSCALAPP